MSDNNSEDIVQFIDSMYIKAEYDTTGQRPVKIHDDALIISYKKNFEQKLAIIEEPTFSFRMVKPDFVANICEDNVPLENTDIVTVKYSELNKKLAELSGKLDAYYNVKRDPNIPWRQKRNFLNALHLNPRFMGSDIDLEDQYKMNFVMKHGSFIGKYKKGAFDIETDGYGTGASPDPETANDPVYALSYYDFTTDAMYVLVWDNPDRYKTLNTFKAKVADGSFERDYIRNDPELNGSLPDSHLSNVNTKYIIEFYEDEFDLICRFYELIHILTPDFVVAWNFIYDNLTLVNRLRKLLPPNGNKRAEDIVCDRDIPSKYRKIFYNEDKSEGKQYFQKWHEFAISGKTSYLCSMAMYAFIRKSAGILPSYSLNDICMLELKKGKEDYHDIAADVVELPHVDFTLAIKYNIKDTTLLAELEMKNRDVDSVLQQAKLTKLSNVSRVTSVVRTAQYVSYFKQGLAMGNNINAIEDTPKAEYDGAIVANPELNSLIQTPLFPFPSRTIRPYVADNDLTSMYPMISIAHNIYKTTLIFELKKVGELTPFSDDPGIFDVQEMMSNYECRDNVRWGHQYLNLPNIDEMVKLIDKRIGVDKC